MTTTNTNNKRQIEESPVKERKRRDLGTDKAPSSVPAASTASVSEEAVAAAAVAAAADNSSQRTSLVGTIAPQFTATAVLPDGAFQDVSLSDFADKHTVVLFADNSCFSPESTFAAELPAFSAAITSNASGSSECHVIAISADSHFALHQWVSAYSPSRSGAEMKLTLISDITQSIAKQFGVYNERTGHSMRATFIIDPKVQKIRIATVHDPVVGRSVSETLRLVQALQFHEKYGEVCPANWQPGGDGIVPTPEGSKAYFDKHF